MFSLNNPNRLLQPWKNVKQFSEELYAMFTSKAPVEREGQVTIRVKEGQTALRLVRGEDIPTPSFAALRPRAVPVPQQTAPSSVAPAAPPSRQVLAPPPDQPPPTKKYRPMLSVEGGADFRGRAPVRFDQPPQVFNQSTQQYVPMSSPSDGSTAPPILPSLTPQVITKTYFGRVASGTGKTWSVSISGDDLTSPQTVSVSIPLIEDSEQAPAGLGMVVVKVGDSYFGQPPVWLE